MDKNKVEYTSPTVNTVLYNSFKGIDASTDPMLISREHFAMGTNLISDYSGMPEKRIGYRTLNQFNGKVNGIYFCSFEDKDEYIVHSGANMYIFDMANKTTKLLSSNIGDFKSMGFWYDGKQYILTGQYYLVYDGQVMKLVSEIATVPTIFINKKPDGSDMATLDTINLLSSKWAEEFLGDGTSKVYQLAYGSLDNTAVVVEEQVSLGVWEVMPDDGYTIDKTLGKVTFTTAPPEPTVTGMSNIKITASKVFEGYVDKINKCTIASVFEDNTVFLAGSKKAVDYYSKYADPTYFSDLSFTTVGTDATDIMGYLKLGENQVIIKEDNNQDATVYIRSKIYDENAVRFVTDQGAVGVGSISKYANGNLRDDVLFLSRQGIFAITSSAITLERSLQNRSYFIDKILTAEPNLETAVAVVWQGYYIVSVNGNCYVLDGKQEKSYTSQSGADFIYQSYIWDNIHANCFLEVGGKLFFGTESGKLCMFNTDILDLTKYSDDGEAIVVKVATKIDDFGSFNIRKTLQKRGSGLVVKPNTRASFHIYMRANYDPVPQFIKTGYKDMLSWDDINWNRITFNSNDNPSIEFFKKKIKKFTSLQLFIYSDKPNESFGLFKVIYCYTMVGYDK